MKNLYFLIGVICITLITLITSCENEQQRGERLAKKYCSSCHMFPDPSMLNKTTWEKSVLPDMRFRMGFEGFNILTQLTMEDQSVVLKTIPGQPMVSEEEWALIKKYYVDTAPDSLTIPAQPHADTLTQFAVTSFRLPSGGIPANSLLKTDTINHKIYLGTRSSWIYQLNTDFHMEDSVRLNSPASQLLPQAGENPWVLLMGIMDPNDQLRGEITSLNINTHETNVFIDSLKRPVFMERADLNKDNLKDVVVCAFGNYTGELLAYKNTGQGYQRYVLNKLPGARKVVVHDFDGNGLVDILALMTQGDEQIILLSNQGDFNFKITSLLRFPPVYGSSFIDVADFNGDGKFDILYTNGDNADVSMILKPYHSVKIFTNDGSNHFEESWSTPFHGASQAVANDFDQDGDLDIAAISFFPDFNKTPERGFMYFENKGKNVFTPYVTPLASRGRWITIDVADVDNDQDKDILLGALDFDPGVPPKLLRRWTRERTSVLILKNNLH